MAFMDDLRERVRGRCQRIVSRGCSVQDLADVAVVSAAQALVP